MQWTDDVSRGDWIRERLTDWSTITGFVPAGFDMYARVFPKMMASRHIPTIDGELDKWEHQWLSWSDVAERMGKTMHCTAQSGAITGVYGENTNLDLGDGWYLSQSREGLIPPEDLAAVVNVLPTTTPDDITMAFWVGWSELNPSSCGAISFVGATQDEMRRTQEELQRQLRARISDNVFRAVKRDEDQLHLPNREYVLLTTTVDELADPTWPHRAGIGWSEPGDSYISDGPMPALVWPEDRAWCIATEIDFDTTLVGGTVEAISALCQSPDLEALVIRPDAILDPFGDTING